MRTFHKVHFKWTDTTALHSRQPESPVLYTIMQLLLSAKSVVCMTYFQLLYFKYARNSCLRSFEPTNLYSKNGINFTMNIKPVYEYETSFNKSITPLLSSTTSRNMVDNTCQLTEHNGCKN